MLPKTGEDAKTEDIIKVLESIGTVALRLKMEEKEGPFGFNKQDNEEVSENGLKVDYYKYGMSCHGSTVRCLPYGWAFFIMESVKLIITLRD